VVRIRGRIAILIALLTAALACQLVPTARPEPTSTPAPTVPPPPTQTTAPTIAPEPTLTAPAAAGLDRVNIYLVAMGDNGATGRYIGCGDSLVPVEISITPTLGVLRAAINELLKLEGEQVYGESGLYNALYLSSLTLDDVAVVNGEAVIAFSGTLIYGGECDIPRIEEQLKALALQFSTVDRVSITVNGTLLETLLDLRG